MDKPERKRILAVMEKRGMNERVQALRELSVTTQPHIDMERAKSETATYKKYEGQLSVPELRAQVLYDYFATKTLYIGDGELIVGEKGDSPHGAPTFPELCCHTCLLYTSPSPRDCS